MKAGRCNSNLPLKADLGAEGGDVLAAVGLGDEGSVGFVIGNALEYGNITGGHGELGLEIHAGGQELDEEPAGHDFLIVILFEYAYAGALGNDLVVAVAKLRYGAVPTSKG